ncbi:MAG: beta-lactamase [Acidimicrobiales bacterium]|nr:beta-lactamase [Acidimicrobiales bacterium]
MGSHGMNGTGLRFDRVTEALQAFIDRGDLSGIVTLTWQGGKLLHTDALGWRDLGSRAPMQRDALFRIASMTKPITTVAALMLMEEGALSLADPIAKWAPEFANMRVLRNPSGPLSDTEPARRLITVEDLMTHRAGLTYGFSATGPIVAAYEHKLGTPPGSPLGPDDWMMGLASLPLLHQPGDRMHYSHATELLGFLIGRIAGAPLREVLIEKLLKRLGMSDTDFWVPPNKRNRLVTPYRFSEDKQELIPTALPPVDALPIHTAGGGALISTADDYLRFAQMLLRDGVHEGIQLLNPETVRMMRTNHLTTAQREIPFMGMPLWVGSGFGLGLSIVDHPERNALGMGSAGAFSWPGAYGTWWQAEPEKDLIQLFMIQHSIPLTPEVGAQMGVARGMAGRAALPIFQKMTYEALDARPN